MDSIHDFVLAELESRKGDWPAIARGSGVPYSTLKKIALGTNGGTKSPRIDSLEKLAAYLRQQSAQRPH